MIIARRLLRDRRRSLMWWSIGVAGVVALVIGMYPSIEGKQGFEKLFNNLPAAIKAMMGMKGISIISAEGYLHGRLFATFIPLLLTIFAIGLGSSAIGGSETDGTLELLLANPVSRRAVAVERLAVLVLLVTVLGVVAVVSIVALMHIVGGSMAAIPVTRVCEATAGATCLALLHGAVAFATGCVTGNRGKAIATATIFAVAGYLIQVLTLSVDGLSGLGGLSPWRWYLDRMALIDGLTVVATAAPLALGSALVVAGIAMFERRDLR